MSQRKWRYIKLLLINACLYIWTVCPAQCPVNIGFETGGFGGWECSTGLISAADGSITLDKSEPTAGRHTIFPNTNLSLDPYGHFPVSCPNGSGYSIRLGNNATQRQAEQVSYTFTIPATENNYSIIYNYAVVFQNPDHGSWEQPKFTANVFDVTTNTYIGCSSFSYTASSGLPGFKSGGGDSSVFYKSWTPVTIKLAGYAGRTIRLEFTTNDCSRGGHFGYAYIDVNENCSSPISGNIQCSNDSAQTLIAPFGFMGYRWFPGDFSRVIDSTSYLHFTPVPPQGNMYAVEVTPYPGQGCTDTVYTTIVYSGGELILKTPPAPLLTCVTTGVDLTGNLVTSGSSPGLNYAFYNDPFQQEYVGTPKSVTESGTYYVRATNSAGCVAVKPVTVTVYKPPDVIVKEPLPTIRPASIDLTATISRMADVDYTYWKDAAATIRLSGPESVNRTGTYYIKITNLGGCSVITAVTVVVGEPPVLPPNAFSPNGDGIHDLWEVPVLYLYPECVVEIFNRLGQKIYRSTPGYLQPWDGRYKGLDQPVGTYYYIIKLTNELPVVGGSVTIIR